MNSSIQSNCGYFIYVQLGGDNRSYKSE